MSDLYSDQMAAFLPGLIGQPYWYGTHLNPCTDSLLDRKRTQFPDWYTDDRLPTFRAQIAAHNVCSDCVGMIKGYAWTNGGVGVLESIGTGNPIHQDYQSNGCPDLSANDMYEWAVSQGAEHGAISTLPEIPGIVVHKNGHCGVYIGNGHIIEFRGYGAGCQQTNVSSRDFTAWYKLPFINYRSSRKFLPIGGKRRVRYTIWI